MLTDRQQLTLKRIKDIYKIESSEDIIKFCLSKVKQFRKTSYTQHPNAPRQTRRVHSKEYYFQIIEHYSRPA